MVLLQTSIAVRDYPSSMPNGKENVGRRVLALRSASNAPRRPRASAAELRVRAMVVAVLMPGLDQLAIVRERAEQRLASSSLSRALKLPAKAFCTGCPVDIARAMRRSSAQARMAFEEAVGKDRRRLAEVSCLATRTMMAPAIS